MTHHRNVGDALAGGSLKTLQSARRRVRRRSSAIAFALLWVLAATACSRDQVATTSPPPLPSASISVRPDATATPGTRLPIAPRLKVQNVAFGRSHKHLDQAIDDLKAVAVWRKLTGHLYVVKISSRPGLHDVPKDDHLADAYLRGYIDDEGQGAMCDIKFFPAALNRDLENWRSAYRRGAYPDPPPTVRQYWAAILGHELAHCYGHGRGEPFARRWEATVLALVRDRL